MRWSKFRSSIDDISHFSQKTLLLQPQSESICYGICVFIKVQISQFVRHKVLLHMIFIIIKVEGSDWPTSPTIMGNHHH